MPRQKTGSIITKNGKLYARIRFVDETGKKRDLWKSVSSKAEAKKKIKELIKENESKSAKELDASRMSFNQLADYYQETYLHEAVYINERKISGLRDIRPTLSELKALREHFGTRLIQKSLIRKFPATNWNVLKLLARCFDSSKVCIGVLP
jgi:hypothetical protein